MPAGEVEVLPNPYRGGTLHGYGVVGVTGVDTQSGSA